ncbi:MAG: hypothetical protein JW797_14795 [Bradymonadales bacterium]|nr:hypothetical protein [Bradymonadales bacterium]
MRKPLTRLACLALVALSGCGDDQAVECRAGADCASGICLSNGRCAPLEGDADMGQNDDALTVDDCGQDPNGDTTTDPGDQGMPDQTLPDGSADLERDGDSGPLLCIPNHDGLIDRSEIPLQAGLRATFRVTGDVDVDTAGTTLPDDSRTWDLSGPLEGDHSVLVELRPPTGQWFADDFPDATYFTPLSDKADLLGVFQVTDEALLLLGVVSPEETLFTTELTYDPPIVVLSLPLELDKSWTTDSTVEGTLVGVWGVYWEDYESRVDAHGTLKTPYGTFPVLRVRVHLSRLQGVLLTEIRSFYFVTECFGTVAAITSEQNEAEMEFTRADEIRRLAP